MLANIKILCQLVKGLPFKVAGFIGLFSLEWHSQNEVANIGILALWRDREKLYWLLSLKNFKSLPVAISYQEDSFILDSGRVFNSTARSTIKVQLGTI